MSRPYGVADERFDEAGFEVPFARTFEGEPLPPRARCQNLPTGNDNVSCSHHPQTTAKLCAPGANITCPGIPELWVSSTIEGVPFYYGAVVRTVEGTGGKRKALVRAKNKSYEVRLTPIAWRAAQRWITSMSTFGMPIAAVITAGAGPYCRCIKTPKGICRHDNPGGCTGKKLSNHGAGDAIDITGVMWKDHHSVGSSLKVTLMHSWSDAADQAPLLVRINAALRLSFATVIDYSDPGHRDHFHVDTNNGVARSVFGMETERWFLAGCLRSLGYIERHAKPPTWADVQPGLAAFARQTNIAVPAAGDKDAWRAIVARVYGCVAFGTPDGCIREATRAETLGPESGNTPFDHEFTPLGSDVERALVTAQIAAGERDVEKLTDFIFNIGHPALKGTRLGGGQASSRVNWRRIRDELVLPLLAETAATPVLRLEHVNFGNERPIPLVPSGAGVYRGTLPRAFQGQVATLEVTGHLVMEEMDRGRAFTNADRKTLGPLKVVAIAIPRDGISSSFAREVPVDSSGGFRTETQIGTRTPARLVQIQVVLKGHEQFAARVVLELVDLPGFLAIVDANERERDPSQSHLAFLASVRKMFQGGPNSELKKVFNLVLYRHRDVDPLFKEGSRDASRLQAYANGLWADGEVVDIGHVLCGIEGSPLQDPMYDQKDLRAFFDPPTRLRIVTWAGDLGSALDEYIKKLFKADDRSKPTNLADCLAIHAGRRDLIGDLDGINIGAVYQAGRSLADNLSAYYGSTNRRRYRRFIELSTSAAGNPLFPLVPGSNPPKLALAARRHIAEQALAFQAAVSLSKGFSATLEPSKRRLYAEIVKKDSAQVRAVVDHFAEFLESGLAQESRQR